MKTKRAEIFMERIRSASSRVGRRARFMEVCGTHTHAIARAGLKSILADYIDLVSGPGCPVCVTSQADIETMLKLARSPEITITTFGDMVRVPGIESSLEEERARGADVKVVYSPADALQLARSTPDRQIVFLAVGFETTAPVVAKVILDAAAADVSNFSCYIAHKLIPPAMSAVLEGTSALDGFLTPGHVSVIIGADAYREIAEKHAVPCVVTGFEPTDIMEGLAMLVELLDQGRNESQVQYRRAVTPEGNRRAREVMDTAFEVTDAEWRGLGTISRSGLRLREAYEHFDASKRFSTEKVQSGEIPGCRCGDVLKGLIRPEQCGLFGKKCTPAAPVGPCMVSSEGSCAARYRYG